MIDNLRLLIEALKDHFKIYNKHMTQSYYYSREVIGANHIRPQNAKIKKREVNMKSHWSDLRVAKVQNVCSYSGLGCFWMIYYAYSLVYDHNTITMKFTREYSKN